MSDCHVRLAHLVKQVGRPDHVMAGHMEWLEKGRLIVRVEDKCVRLTEEGRWLASLILGKYEN